jgi:hypothetical protein
MATETSRIADVLLTGTPVEVRSRFSAAWVRGFEVASRTQRGYQLRRLSDGSVLPVRFAPHDIRRRD